MTKAIELVLKLVATSADKDTDASFDQRLKKMGGVRQVEAGRSGLFKTQSARQAA